VVRHSLENSTEAAFAAYLRAWAKSDFSDKVQADTSTPVKLIVGVNDPALSADVMEQTWLVFFPEAEMTILSDAGHYPMFESPVSLATSIEEFLGRD
jgi:pimeloyl-ACP methyl ester carboxylesterase